MRYFTTFIFMSFPPISFILVRKKLFLIEKSFTTLYDVGECGKYAAVQTNNIERGFEVFSEIENNFFYVWWGRRIAITIEQFTKRNSLSFNYFTLLNWKFDGWGFLKNIETINFFKTDLFSCYKSINLATKNLNVL